MGLFLLEQEERHAIIMVMSPKKQMSPDLEPTLHDAIGMLKIVDSRVEKGFRVMNERMDGIDVRLITSERNVTKLQGMIMDIQEDLTAALAATDSNSFKIINHDKRICTLEKVVVR